MYSSLEIGCGPLRSLLDARRSELAMVRSFFELPLVASAARPMPDYMSPNKANNVYVA
jgi:hypothetical protein